MPSDAVARLQALIRVPTISRLGGVGTDWDQFDRLSRLLAELYPATHRALELETIGGHSLLYRWAGREPGEPTVLMAHLDVVAARPEGWEHPPFAAELVGVGEQQMLWGRGAIDDKAALACILEAVELAVAAGRTPRNDIYLSFGHDEETDGSGAEAIVAELRARGIRPRLVLDEGGAVVSGVFPGVSGPIAVVGVSERGFVTATLTAEQQGGHASTPPRFNAAERLARAIVRLGSHPFPARFPAPTIAMLRALGAHAGGPMGWAFRNLWLTRRVLLSVFKRLGPETAALTRTTQAVTMLSGSESPNALAERAVATLSIRVALESTVAEALAHVRRAIGDAAVRVDVLQSFEPSPVSPAAGPAWELLESSILHSYPGVLVLPYVQLGASDSRHFTSLTECVYRFSPFELSRPERDALHAANERISVATFLRGIQFYRRLVESL